MTSFTFEIFNFKTRAYLSISLRISYFDCRLLKETMQSMTSLSGNLDLVDQEYLEIKI